MQSDLCDRGDFFIFGFRFWCGFGFCVVLLVSVEGVVYGGGLGFLWWSGVDMAKTKSAKKVLDTYTVKGTHKVVKGTLVDASSVKS